MHPTSRGDPHAPSPPALHPIAVLALILVAVLPMLLTWAAPTAAATGAAPPTAAITPANSTFHLSASGTSPAALGLSWTAATDLLFTGYALYVSTSGAMGPWSHVASVADQLTVTYYVDGLSPGSTYWWEATYNDSLLGTTYSNVLTVKLPAVATLTASLVTPAMARLRWTDSADYSGFVAFRSYRVLQLSDTGATTALGTVYNVSMHSFDVGPLGNNTTYQFRVDTTDGCSGASNCGSSDANSTTASSVARLTTLTTLVASVSANVTSFVEGSNVSLLCAATGGRPPYFFVWNFGDGRTGSGALVSHKYDRNGSYTAGCTVTDSFASSAFGATTLTVTPRSTSGGGGNGSGSGNGTGNGSGSGSGSGNGSGSGSGTPPGNSSSGTSPTPGPKGPGGLAFSSPLLGPIAAVVLFASFIAAVAWLALLARRRNRESAAGDPSTGPAPPVDPSVPTAAASGPTEAAPVAPAPAPPPPSSDLDRLMDELENASTDRA